MKKRDSSISNQDILKEIKNLNKQIADLSRANTGLIDINTAARLYNIKVSYLYQLTSKSNIPKYKPGGKKIYFDIDELRIWFKSHRSHKSNPDRELENLYTKADAALLKKLK